MIEHALVIAFFLLAIFTGLSVLFIVIAWALAIRQVFKYPKN